MGIVFLKLGIACCNFTLKCILNKNSCLIIT
ncbi:MAG: hypothetical protein RIS50_1193, partial [Bacteroidota bacterium]